MKNNLENATAFFLKANREGNSTAPEILFAYANTVRPVVVMPKCSNNITAYRIGWDECVDEIKRLNPDLTFSESK